MILVKDLEAELSRGCQLAAGLNAGHDIIGFFRHARGRTTTGLTNFLLRLWPRAARQRAGDDECLTCQRAASRGGGWQCCQPDTSSAQLLDDPFSMRACQPLVHAVCNGRPNLLHRGQSLDRSRTELLDLRKTIAQQGGHPRPHVANAQSVEQARESTRAAVSNLFHKTVRRFFPHPFQRR